MHVNFDDSLYGLTGLSHDASTSMAGAKQMILMVVDYRLAVIFAPLTSKLRLSFIWLEVSKC